MLAAEFVYLFTIGAVVQAQMTWEEVGIRKVLFRPTPNYCPLTQESLVRCPPEMECTDQSNCSEHDICCPNQCGTSTCVAPRMPAGVGDHDQSLCSNSTCHEQGRECLVHENRTFCVCIRTCPQIMTNENIVCDVNGTMHPSLCWLNKRACEAGITIVPTRCSKNIERSPYPGKGLSPPVFPVTPIVRNKISGERIAVGCRPSGNPTPEIRWRLPSGEEVLPGGHSRNGRFHVDNDGTLTIETTQLSDSGNYRCIASNEVSTTAVDLSLKVKDLETYAGSNISWEEWKRRCGPTAEDQNDPCRPNEDLTIRKLWLYDSKSNICSYRYFRDCRPAPNRFRSKELCEKSCSVDICSLPAVMGPCTTFQTRVAYDNETGSCRPFFYGGCGGNINNFPNVHVCKATCGKGPRFGNVPVLECSPCQPQEARVVCASHFVFVANIKFHHLGEYTHDLKRLRYLQVNIEKVLADWTENETVLRRNLRDPHQSRMDIKLSLPEKCPCPNLQDLLPSHNSSSNSSRSRARRPRLRSLTTIIAGTMVNGYPTLTSKGMLQKNTTKVYNRVVNSIKTASSLCKMITSVDTQGR